MLIIGISATHHNAPIIRLLKCIFTQYSKKCITLTSSEMRAEYAHQLKSAGIDFAVVDIGSGGTGGIFFDVLVLDNTAGDFCADAVEKSISASTVIIYNGDVSECDVKCRCAKVSYGLSEKCDISVSSVVRDCDGVKIVCGVQNAISDVYGQTVEISESAVVLSDENVNIHHALGAIACAAACGVI